MSWKRAHPLSGFDVCFGWYLRGLLRRSFARIFCSGESQLPPGGYVAAANHNGWWDGLIPYFLHHERRAAGAFSLMMSDAELRRFPFFRLGGAFSVDTASVRAAREAILYAGARARSGAAVWIYPDGVLRPPGSHLCFTSGFVHAARAAQRPIVPVALRYAMLARDRPEAFVAFGVPHDANARGAQASVQNDVAELLARIDDDIREGSFERYRVALVGRAGADDTVGAVTAHLPVAR